VVDDEKAHERIMQQENAQRAAESLGMLALESHSVDNVGIIVLKIDWK
jgi:serine/threonine protein phosphatase PrpC